MDCLQKIKVLRGKNILISSKNRSKNYSKLGFNFGFQIRPKNGITLDHFSICFPRCLQVSPYTGSAQEQDLRVEGSLPFFLSFFLPFFPFPFLPPNLPKNVPKSRFLGSQNPPKTLPKSLPNRCPKKRQLFRCFSQYFFHSCYLRTLENMHFP